MNLFAFLRQGAAHAPKPSPYTPAQLRAIEGVRLQWLNALLVDQTRAWLSLGEHAPEVLHGMATMLTIATFAAAHGTGRDDGADIRIMRGAVSAATQCARNGAVLTADDARAFRAACDRARAIIEAATPAAIIHAAESIRKTVGLT